MKFFSSILPTVGIAMLGAVSVLAQSSDVIITGLQTVTQSSRDLRTVVETITLFNAPVQGPVSIHPFQQLIAHSVADARIALGTLAS